MKRYKYKIKVLLQTQTKDGYKIEIAKNGRFYTFSVEKDGLWISAGIASKYNAGLSGRSAAKRLAFKEILKDRKEKETKNGILR